MLHRSVYSAAQALTELRQETTIKTCEVTSLYHTFGAARGTECATPLRLLAGPDHHPPGSPAAGDAGQPE